MGQEKKRRNKVEDEEDHGIMILNYIPKCFERVEFSNSNSKDKRFNYIPKWFERIESSNSKDKHFICEICTNPKTTRDAFYISGCSHAYCSDCVAMYIISKLERNITFIGCPLPGCSGSLEADFCRSILLPKDFERWSKVLSEDVFNVSDKFYCPFSDCGAFLINDSHRTEAVRNLECPNCKRMLCAQCKVPWHEGIECNEFKNLNRNDKGKEAMLTHLAKDTKWRQCPYCRIYVAKSGSCNIMKCKGCCRFCYKCGGVFFIGKCNCYKRTSFKGGAFQNRITIYLANQLNNTLQSLCK